MVSFLAMKDLVWIELTSPWEENMNDWHFKKLRKYQKLERTAKRNGWNEMVLDEQIPRNDK